MSTVAVRRENFRNNPGYALLAILIIAVGAMFLLVALYSGSLNPFSAFEGSEADRYSDPNASPWHEGRLFINPQLDTYDMGGRRPPFPAQPKIEANLRYKATAYEGDEQRGEIVLAIRKNGEATAGWQGEFKIGRTDYKAEIDKDNNSLFKANVFNGNIAPLKIYTDEKGNDRSKLYVITQGAFRLEGSNKSDNVSGAAYITAWIDRDYSATGKLWIQSLFDGGDAVFEWGPVSPSR